MQGHTSRGALMVCRGGSTFISFLPLTTTTLSGPPSDSSTLSCRPSFQELHQVHAVCHTQPSSSSHSGSSDKSFSPVQLFATPWTVACQALLCMGFSKQEYWSGLLFPSSGDLPRGPSDQTWVSRVTDSLLYEPAGLYCIILLLSVSPNRM